MKRYLWKSAFATGLMCGSFWLASPAQSGIFFNRTKPKPAPTAATNATTNPAPSDDQTIVLQEPGKPERKCLIEKSVPQPDGTVIQHLRALDNGDRMTIVTGKATPKVEEPAKSKTPVAGLPVAADRKADPLFPPGYDPKAPKFLSTAAVASKSKPAPTAPASTLPSRSRLDELLGKTPAPTPPLPAASVMLPTPSSATNPAPGVVPTPMTAAKVVTATPVSLPKPVPAEPKEAVPSTLAPGQAQMIVQLVEAVRPSDREAAAAALTAGNAPLEGDIVGILVHAMRNDASPSVRAACVRNLSRRGCTDPTFVAGLDTMRGDQDKLVQSECAAARGRLGVK